MIKYPKFLTLLFFLLMARNGLGAALSGHVTDNEGRPLADVNVFIPELARGATTDADGHFRLLNLPAQLVRVEFSFIGYKTEIVHIDLSGKSPVIDVVLQPTTIEMKPVMVREIAQSADEIKTTPILLNGQILRENLGMTIAETLNNEPGLDQRTMGPAPARPVLRGLSGDRLLVLEDGERTGDLSATSADHAVAIEPMTAEQVEVIRGPSTLLYGSNTLGGVINVVRNHIPGQIPDRIAGSLSVQSESVNTSASTGLRLSIPYQKLSLNMDGSLRQAEDVHTPKGKLRNTGITTFNGSISLGWHEPWGLLSISGSWYNSDYGIPGGFAGAHPNGVTVKMERLHQESALTWTPNTRGCASWLKRLEITQTFTHYDHQEVETGDIIGISFSVDTHNYSTLAHLRPYFIFDRGAIGLRGEYRYFVMGGLSFAPDNTEQTLAAFWYQSAQIRNVSFESALRFDYRRVDPDDDEEGIYDDEVGLIRPRTFNGLSTSLAAAWPLVPNLEIGGSVMRSFRSPLSEELYSQGPHLAAYSYEVGNTDLGSETGLGKEVFARFESEKIALETYVFHNDIRNFIFVKETGDTVWNLILPKYKHTGLDAVMLGVESQFTWECVDRWTVRGTVSYVQGELTDFDQDIPRIPPLKGQIGLTYEVERFKIGATLRWAGRQERLGEFEQPTDAYQVIDAHLHYLFSWSGLLHSIDLMIDNTANEEYYNHLSRVKSVMPEPGRNIKLLYKLYF